jgi:hypothetical protein
MRGFFFHVFDKFLNTYVFHEVKFYLIFNKKTFSFIHNWSIGCPQTSIVLWASMFKINADKNVTDLGIENLRRFPRPKSRKKVFRKPPSSPPTRPQSFRYLPISWAVTSITAITLPGFRWLGKQVFKLTEPNLTLPVLTLPNLTLPGLTFLTQTNLT